MTEKYQNDNDAYNPKHPESIQKIRRSISLKKSSSILFPPHNRKPKMKKKYYYIKLSEEELECLETAIEQLGFANRIVGIFTVINARFKIYRTY